MERIEEQDIKVIKKLHSSPDRKTIIYLATLRSKPTEELVVKQFSVDNTQEFNQWNQHMLGWCMCGPRFATVKKVLFAGGKHIESLKGIFKRYTCSLDLVLNQPLSAFDCLEALLQGIAVLESRHIVHGNICPENILLEVDSQNKVIFVLCGQRCMTNATTNLENAQNAFRAVLPYKNMDYAAPELAINQVHTPASDLYSCGLVGLQVALRITIAQIRASPSLDSLLAQVPDSRVVRLLTALLSHDPNARQSATSILQAEGIELDVSPNSVTRKSSSAGVPEVPTLQPSCRICRGGLGSADLDCCGSFYHRQCLMSDGYPGYILCPSCQAAIVGHPQILCNLCGQHFPKLYGQSCRNHYCCSSCTRSTCEICAQERVQYTQAQSQSWDTQFANQANSSIPNSSQSCQTCRGRFHSGQSCLDYSISSTDHIVCKDCNSPCPRKPASYYALCTRCSSSFCIVCFNASQTHSVCKDRFTGTI